MRAAAVLGVLVCATLAAQLIAAKPAREGRLHEALANRRREFVRQYQDKCLKYDWLVDYIHDLYKVEGLQPKIKPPVQKVAIQKGFIFDKKKIYNELRPSNDAGDRFAVGIFQADDKKIQRKGVGDRFGGLLSVFFWALRSGRTFLLEDEQGLISSLFRPVPLHILGSRSSAGAAAGGVGGAGPLRSTLTEQPTWANWSWAGYNYSAARVNFTDCVDAELENIAGPCRFHYSGAWPDQKVVRISTNRCWLCSWTMYKHAEVTVDMRRMFHFDRASSDLYEWAGCALRTILWPTQEMWQRMDKYYAKVLHADPVPRTHLVQIGTHFRCGDNSFAAGKYNASECVVGPDNSWQPLRPVTDVANTSPVDLGKCAAAELRKHAAADAAVAPIFVIASDSPDSAKQIQEVANYPSTYVQPPGCHIADNETASCGDVTVEGWFSLALSQQLVVQSPSTEKTLNYPVSSFSRYAMIYGMSSGHIKYGDKCDLQRSPTKNYVSRGLDKTQGNWRCEIAWQLFEK